VSHRAELRSWSKDGRELCADGSCHSRMAKGNMAVFDVTGLRTPH
jgi:hypothetical protein